MFQTVLYDLSAEQRDWSFLFYATVKERIATQDTKFSENATEHIPNLVCVQQFCSVCEMQDEIDID
jgi:hypothetical protein